MRFHRIASGFYSIGTTQTDHQIPGRLGGHDAEVLHISLPCLLDHVVTAIAAVEYLEAARASNHGVAKLDVTNRPAASIFRRTIVAL
ncbi:hypothetical protein [Candidatus Binatus sp.]|uniref:hypothetical protein n=1 Tax=Candidatus Binatus sp. TaxID=2811406 RepID=UPI003CC5244D